MDEEISAVRCCEYLSIGNLLRETLQMDLAVCQAAICHRCGLAQSLSTNCISIIHSWKGVIRRLTTVAMMYVLRPKPTSYSRTPEIMNTVAEPLSL